MKKLTVFMCLFAAVHSAYAQPAEMPNPFQMPAGAASIIGRTVIESIQNGFGNTMTVMMGVDNADMRKELALTDKETNALKGLRMQLMLKAPLYAARMKDMKETDLKALQAEIADELKTVNEQIDKMIAPEQKAKTQKLLFQSLGGLHSPLMCIDMMAPLHLSEEQKKKMQSVFDEMKAEREALMESGFKLMEKGIAMGKDMQPEDRKKLREERQLMEVQMYEIGKKLGDRLRSHLTPAQLEEEKVLIASRPAFLPKLPKGMQGLTDKPYAPGEKSWKPGQDVPAQPEEPKRKPFPKTEE